MRVKVRRNGVHAPMLDPKIHESHPPESPGAHKESETLSHDSSSVLKGTDNDAYGTFEGMYVCMYVCMYACMHVNVCMRVIKNCMYVGYDTIILFIFKYELFPIQKMFHPKWLKFLIWKLKFNTCVIC